MRLDAACTGTWQLIDDMGAGCGVEYETLDLLSMSVSLHT